jgi:hypothetical protein
MLARTSASGIWRTRSCNRQVSALHGQADMTGTVSMVGVAQSLRDRRAADRPHCPSQVLFQFGGNFGRNSDDLVTASSVEPKKTLLCRILTEMAFAEGRSAAIGS